MDISEFAKLRLTDRVRKVLDKAPALAARSKDGFVGTQHVLLAMFQVGGVAVEVLRHHEINVHACRAIFRKLQVIEDAATDSAFTRSTMDLMDVAVAVRRELGHPYVGTEHLLLAMTRVENCVAHQVLKSFDLTHEVLRTDVQTALGTPLDE